MSPERYCQAKEKHTKITLLDNKYEESECILENSVNCKGMLVHADAHKNTHIHLQYTT